jgi:hypothetical protein
VPGNRLAFSFAVLLVEVEALKTKRITHYCLEFCFPPQKRGQLCFVTLGWARFSVMFVFNQAKLSSVFFAADLHDSYTPR